MFSGERLRVALWSICYGVGYYHDGIGQAQSR
jgi:hypothetical protein